MNRSLDPPASLQSCGFVVACNEGGEIVSASKNLLDVLRVTEGDLLRRPIDDVLPGVFPATELGHEQHRQLLTGRFPAHISSDNIASWVRLIKPDIPNPTGIWRVLEIRPEEEGGAEQGQILGALARTALLCRKATDISGLATGLTSTIRTCFACDRVSFCKIDQGNLAYVVAEDTNERLPSCLGLTFPAQTLNEDEQERLLLNRALFEADHAAKRVSLIGEPLSEHDLKRLSLYSANRAQSEVMLLTGARTTITLAVVLRGKLFGLVHCSYAEPRLPGVALRHATETFTQLLSSGVDQVWQREHDRHSNEGRVVRKAMLSSVEDDVALTDLVAEHATPLRSALDACNVLVLADNTVHQFPQSHAQIPGEQLSQLAEHLRLQFTNGHDLYATNELLTVLPDLNVVRGVAGGVVAIRLPDSIVAVLRPELIRSPRWISDAFANEATSQPRRPSSEHSIVRDRSAPWTQEDIAFMEELREGLLRFEAQRLERTAREMRSQMEGSEALEMVLAQLSHELRNPMNPILGWSERLLSGEVGRDEISLGLRAIRRNARVQARLIDNIFDASRIRLGSLEVEREAVDLRSIIQTAVDVVERAASKKNIVIEVEVDETLGNLQLDRTRMSQVFWNLLSNAVNYCPPGSKVWVTAARLDSDLVIEVEDNGPGVDSPGLTSIFDRFQQAAAGRAQDEGLGLGLAIVKGVVELHGGQVSAENTGNGLRFRIVLPLMESGAQTGTASAQGPLRGYRIMLVDDAEDSLELAAAVLRGQGAELRLFTSAPRALDSIDEEVDILISDLGMPEMHGLDFIAQVRERGYRMPAIALTAYRATKDRVASLRAGFQLHLGKPVSNDELVLSVIQLVGIRTAP